MYCTAVRKDFLENELIAGSEKINPRFSNPDRSLNHKREKFKIFEVEP